MRFCRLTSGFSIQRRTLYPYWMILRDGIEWGGGGGRGAIPLVLSSIVNLGVVDSTCEMEMISPHYGYCGDDQTFVSSF